RRLLGRLLGWPLPVGQDRLRQRLRAGLASRGLLGRGPFRGRLGCRRLYLLFSLGGGLVGGRVEDLEWPVGEAVTSPGDLLAVVPADLDRSSIGPDEAALDAIVGAAHPAAHLQGLEAARVVGSDLLLAGHVRLL